MRRRGRKRGTRRRQQGAGVKEEEPAEDIEEVKAETEDVAVEDTGGGRGAGGFGCDSLVEG